MIVVHLNEKSPIPAKVIHRDPINDWAVLKIKEQIINFLHVAPIRSARAGNRVFTIGFPVSSILGRKPKYSEGVISSVSGIRDTITFLQITVPVQLRDLGDLLCLRTEKS